MDILPSDSRFLFTDKIKYDGKKTFNRWVAPDVVGLDNTRFSNYVVTAERQGRPDQISEDIYGTHIYWWILVAYNAPRNTLNWPLPGETIKAPLIADILVEL